MEIDIQELQEYVDNRANEISGSEAYEELEQLQNWISEKIKEFKK